MSIEQWKFHPSLGEKRIKNLLNPPSSDEIFENLKNEMAILCGHVENEQKFNNGSYRYRYCILISNDTFDLFFNSTNGYRGWFYRSEEEGDSKNRELISLLTSILLEKYAIHGHSAEQIGHSLQLDSAKVWLVEKGKEMCEHCLGEWSPPDDITLEIRNGRWENSQNIQGCKAYRFNKLFIFSGFHFPDGTEYIPQDKKNRSKEIMDTGWAGN